MRLQEKLKFWIGLMLICTFSINAQNGANETVDQLLKEYRDNGVEEALKAYQKSNNNKEYQGLQEPLNVLGYRLLNEENDADAAEAVFLAQIEEYPNEPNPHDSYADALIKLGNEEEAKKHLKKSILLLEDKQNDDFKKNLMLASKSKLAKLEGKHKSLNFLAGTWEIKNYAVKDGEKTLRYTDDVSFEPSKFNSVIITRILNEEDEFEGTQMITYDAVNDEFDVVRVDNSQLNGFHTSTFKVKENSDSKVVMMENWEENNESRQVKHIFHKKDGNMEWEIHEKDDTEKEKMVTYMDMKKKN